MQIIEFGLLRYDTCHSIILWMTTEKWVGLLYELLINSYELKELRKPCNRSNDDAIEEEDGVRSHFGFWKIDYWHERKRDDGHSSFSNFHYFDWFIRSKAIVELGRGVNHLLSPLFICSLTKTPSITSTTHCLFGWYWSNILSDLKTSRH